MLLATSKFSLPFRSCGSARFGASKLFSACAIIIFLLFFTRTFFGGASLLVNQAWRHSYWSSTLWSRLMCLWDKPLPRNDVGQIHVPGAGSLFGHLYMQMDCPGTLEGFQSYSDSRGGRYTPATLFPISRTIPNGQQGQRAQQTQRLNLLVGVLSSCSSAVGRRTARSTWMRLLAPEDTAWQAKFLLSWHCKDSLAVEQEQHGDLLFLRTEETYYSLTPKVFRFFEYADTLGAEYTMKTDDDTFVFVDRVLSELKRMPKTCLYWGGSERLPSADAYRGSGIDIPLNKWYIDEDNFPLLAGTRYMAGGAYVLSRDLVHKIVRRRIVVPPHLPEDASVGRALGDAAFRLCRCSDTRHVKHVSDFQFVQLFHPAVHRCERGDVARRVLTMHGFKNLSQMDEVLSLATAPIELGCKVGKLRYTDWFTYKFWGRGFPKDAHAVNPIWSTSRRYHQLKKIRADPWERRHLFVSYEEDWAAGDGRTAGRTAVPRRAAASSGDQTSSLSGTS
uniref:Hexosyltransferase n=1 Tax=Tetraselmis sp. GSL018 TaxID=582737 RepID=A0A061RK10_9CHLO